MWKRKEKLGREKREKRKDYGIEKRESGLTSIGSGSPVESGGYGLSDIVNNHSVVVVIAAAATILHFKQSLLSK